VIDEDQGRRRSAEGRSGFQQRRLVRPRRDHPRFEMSGSRGRRTGRAVSCAIYRTLLAMPTDCTIR
jgi:hypothetical protein